MICGREDATALAVLHGGIDDGSSQERKRQTEQAAREQGGKRGAKPDAIRTQIAKQLQRLPERFPVQFLLWGVQPRLVIA